MKDVRDPADGSSERLFHVPAGGERRPGERAFGGVGLMIDAPRVVVTAEPADSWRRTIPKM